MTRAIKFRVWGKERKVMEFVGAMDWISDERVVTVNTETKSSTGWMPRMTLYLCSSQDSKIKTVLKSTNSKASRNALRPCSLPLSLGLDLASVFFSHLSHLLTVSIGIPLKERLPIGLAVRVTEMLVAFRRIRLAVLGVILSA